jgi:hypothetical protein
MIERQYLNFVRVGGFHNYRARIKLHYPNIKNGGNPNGSRPEKT